MADKRIIELEERLTLSDGDYLATDNTNGTCKVNAKILLDRLSDNEDAIATKAAKVDLTNISITGSTNNTGSTIASGTYFYKDGTLVKAIAAIANGATLTLNTNYEIVTAGGLNDLNDALTWQDVTSELTWHTTFSDKYALYCPATKELKISGTTINTPNSTTLITLPSKYKIRMDNHSRIYLMRGTINYNNTAYAQTIFADSVDKITQNYSLSVSANSVVSFSVILQ